MDGERHVQSGRDRPGRGDLRALPCRGQFGHRYRQAHVADRAGPERGRRDDAPRGCSGALSGRGRDEGVRLAGRLRRPPRGRHRRRNLCDALHLVEPPHSAAQRGHVARSGDMDEARPDIRQGLRRAFPRPEEQIGVDRDETRRRPAGHRAREREVYDVLGRTDGQHRHVGQPDRLDSGTGCGRESERGGLSARGLFRQRPDRVRPSGAADRQGHSAALQRPEPARRGAGQTLSGAHLFRRADPVRRERARESDRTPRRAVLPSGGRLREERTV